MTLNYLFRTDASKTIGTGHVIRCLTLAEALKEKGAKVFFFCCKHEGNLSSLIEKKGFEFYQLPAPVKGSEPEEDPEHSSGTSWRNDADETGRLIEKLGITPDWLIVDHYALDHRWENKLRPLVKNIFVIDDIANRNHDCDLLHDQNLVLDMQNRYPGKVPDNCRLLLGPDYALLQPVYAELHERIHTRMEPVRNILISFGGADVDNLTGRAISAFISLNRLDIDVDVVISDNSPYKSKIEKLASGHDNIHLHGTLPTLAPLMEKADLAIGAAGTTSWERLCLGLPAIVITMADNQTAIAEGLQHENLVYWIGDKNEVSEDNIRESILRYLNNDLISELSLRCREKIDGKGAERVAAVLTISSETPLNIRHARLSDEKLLLKWVNDPETRRNSFSSEHISPEVHHNWFSRRLRDLNNCIIYIVETEDGIPIGQVRFENNRSNWEIDYSVSPDFRRKNLGRILLNTGLSKFRSEHKDASIIGRVKKNNIPSRKVFESIEFEMSDEGVKEEIVYRYML